MGYALYNGTEIYLKMARIHARVKGKSGSKRPVNADISFVQYKAKDVADLVVKLHNDDVKPSMIGLVLRDRYGIPSVKKITGKSITKILEEKKVVIAVPEDLANLVDKAKALRKHLHANTRDTHNKRGLLLVESRIRRLAKYYKKNGKLADNWSYN